LLESQVDLLLRDIGLIIIAATLMANIARYLKQPNIPAYVLAGLIIGPLGLRLITNQDVIASLGELGIAFLLFIVGLELELKKLKEVGIQATIISLVSAAIIFGLGTLTAIALNYPQIEAIYIGLALTFSSTMVVIKILSDRGELDTLHGRLAITILLVQDVLVVISLIILGSIKNPSITAIAHMLLLGILLYSTTIVGCRKLVCPILISSRNHELTFLAAVSALFVFMQVSITTGFSIAIGAFIAGMTASVSPYHQEVISRVRGLRDFFSIIFFVSLGMQIWAENIITIIIPALIFTLIVVLIKPLVIAFMTRMLGYRKDVSFLTGLTLLQISEFSLIIALQGLLTENISTSVFSQIALVAVLSIPMTSYSTKYGSVLYQKIKKKAEYIV